MNTTHLDQFTRAASVIPALFLRNGRILYQVNPDQCPEIMAAHVGDRGASEVRDLALYSSEGRKIGFISYNGRVWLGTPDTRVDTRVEVPLTGRKTCAELDVEGWN